MILSFTLSMPNNNSWNGKWSGEDDLYVVVKTIRSNKKAQEILDGSSYYYNFGDGWGASISVEEVDAAKARKLRKRSKGFCGYNWMIEDIELYGKILGTEKRASA